MKVERHDDSLVLAMPGTLDRLTVYNYFQFPDKGFASIEFGDGISWSAQDLLTKVNASSPVAGLKLWGTDAAESLTGTADDDVIGGGGGDDVVDGIDGADTLYGEEGNDRLNGGRGRDYLAGEDGNDALDGGVDDDVLQPGGGGPRSTVIPAPGSAPGPRWAGAPSGPGRRWADAGPTRSCAPRPAAQTPRLSPRAGGSCRPWPARIRRSRCRRARAR